MKNQAHFEIMAYIKGHVNLDISDSHTHNKLCQIHGPSVVSKKLAFMWHKKFQDDFTNLKDGSRPGHSKIVVTNANIAAVAGLIKRDARLTVKIIAHGVGISSGSAHKFLPH